MIIEGAFDKLLENLLLDAFPRDQREAFVVGHMAMATLLELAQRNVPYPATRIRLEAPYPYALKLSRAFRADLNVKTELHGKLATAHGESYGINNDNWFEIKHFRRRARSTSGIDRQRNSKRIAVDILRLCVLVEDSGGGARFNLDVFENEPAKWVAFTDPDGNDRPWLRSVLTPGQHDICLDLMTELGGRLEVDGPAALNALIDVRAFAPMHDELPGLYWGYLCNIVEFSVSLGGLKISNTPKDPVDKTQAGREMHRDVARVLVSSLKA